jgi:hypothetical protein
MIFDPERLFKRPLTESAYQLKRQFYDQFVYLLG